MGFTLCAFVPVEFKFLGPQVSLRPPGCNRRRVTDTPARMGSACCVFHFPAFELPNMDRRLPTDNLRSELWALYSGIRLNQLQLGQGNARSEPEDSDAEMLKW